MTQKVKVQEQTIHELKIKIDDYAWKVKKKEE